jgi:hypothetical protein
MASINERIDKFLIGEYTVMESSKEKLDEMELAASETGIKAGEYANLATGLRRIQFRFEKANTPQKYVDAFETVNRLVEKFPLKSKAIWQAVAQAYSIRFGSVSGTAEGTASANGGYSSGPAAE